MSHQGSAYVLSGVLHHDDISPPPSKSRRQVGVTCGFLSRLNAAQVCALGNWLDTAEFKATRCLGDASGPSFSSPPL